MNILNKYIQIYEKENNIEKKIDNILSNLDEVDIKLFKQELSQINFDNIKKDDMFSNSTYIDSQDNKCISYYDDCIIVNKDIIKKFTKNPNKEINPIYTKKIISGNGINIIVINKSEEYTLLIGGICNKENTFKLAYIFNYKREHDLERALEKIEERHTHLNYIEDFCIFNLEKIPASPITNRNGDIVGYGYKYDDILKISLEDYYLCDKFKNLIQLYIYYDFLNNKAKHWYNDHNNTTTLSPDDYCLVNKNWVDRYKKSFDYDMIIPLFNIIKNHDNYKFDANDKKSSTAN